MLAKTKIGVIGVIGLAHTERENMARLLTTVGLFLCPNRAKNPSLSEQNGSKII